MANNNRYHAMIQHAIMYPSGHLDRFANFGPAFEMSANASTHDDRQDAPTIAQNVTNRAESATIGARIEHDHKRFLTAGRAIFTIVGKTSRYTFQLTRKDPTGEYPNPVTFVSLLTGPDNLDSYTYVGIFEERTGTIRLTRKSQYTEQSTPVKAFNWVIARIWRGVEIAPAEIWHVGRCGRCGRALTVPSSIACGLGPECATKV